MKKTTKKHKISLGELIYELFEESSKVTNKRTEQKVLVCVALKDLLERKVNSDHPIVVGSYKH